MKLSKVNELVSFGAALDVKVTPKIMPDGDMGVNIMDFPTFTDFVKAARCLQRYQDEWFGDCSYLVA